MSDHADWLRGWADTFFSGKPVPMTERATKLFWSIGVSLMQDPSHKVPPEVEDNFLYQVILRRAASMGLTIAPWAAVFLAYLCEVPGTAVMYLSAICTKTDRLNFDDLANLFPWGFMPEEHLHSCWEAQKIEPPGSGMTDNRLDLLRREDFDAARQGSTTPAAA